MACYRRDLVEEYKEANDFLSDRLKKISSYLCTMCQIFEADMIDLPNPEIEKWWKNHKEIDKNRLQKELKAIEDENDKIEDISKLSPYERKLLGL